MGDFPDREDMDDLANREDMAATGLLALAVRVSCGYSLVAGMAAGNPPTGRRSVRGAAVARTDEAGNAAMTAAASIQ